MRRKIATFFCVLLGAVLSLEAAIQTAHRRAPYVGAIAIDAKSGRVLLEDSSLRECYPASCTKLMTLRLTLKAIQSGKLKLGDVIYASKVSIREKPSILGLREGQAITVDDAMKALMVKSANDVAVMLAEKVGGTKEHFVEMMNAEAATLGLTRTKFVTPNGYPPERTNRGYDVSCAADLAKLAHTMLQDQPEALRYTSIRTCTIPGVKNREGQLLVMENHNRMMLNRKSGNDKINFYMPEVDGFKTGYHEAGGCSVVLTGQRNGKRAIVVVVGSSDQHERDVAASRMLRDALSALAW